MGVAPTAAIYPASRQFVTVNPSPSERLGDVSSGSNPELTPEPEATSPATVSHGKPAGGQAGTASYYDDGPGLYAALPGWTKLHGATLIVVCADVGIWRCATAPVITSCGCDGPPPKIVDLSPDLFELISGWTPAEREVHGVVHVVVQVIVAR